MHYTQGLDLLFLGPSGSNLSQNATSYIPWVHPFLPMCFTHKCREREGAHQQESEWQATLLLLATDRHLLANSPHLPVPSAIIITLDESGFHVYPLGLLLHCMYCLSRVMSFPCKRYARDRSRFSTLSPEYTQCAPFASCPILPSVPPQHPFFSWQLKCPQCASLSTSCTCL